jgi:hypothetical protein
MCLLPFLLLASLQGAAPAWRPIPGHPEQLALFQDGRHLGNWSFTGKYYRPKNQDGTWGDKAAAPPKGVAEPLQAKMPTALQELNAARARRGLYPYTEDPGLTLAAQRAALWRAQRLVAGHTPNDFAFIPRGTFARAAGCAAWPAYLGWGACLTYDVGPRFAGAGWALGRDGRRYMHTFIR